MTQEEMVERHLFDGSLMNLMAILAGTMGFLKEQGIETSEWIEFVGKSFVSSWEVFHGAGADEVMGHLIPLQIQPLGVEVVSSEGDEREVKLVLSSLPPSDVLERFGTTPEELLDGFGVSAEEFASLYDFFKPAAKAAGFHLTHEPHSQGHSLRLEKSSGGT